MRCVTSALGATFFIAGQALAADPAPTSPPPKAPPQTAEKPAPAGAKPTPKPATAAPAGTDPGGAARAGDGLPPEYYVEPGFAAPEAGANAPPPSAAPSAEPNNGMASAPPGAPPPPPSELPIYEPPPPGFYPGEPVFEPPPPPEPHHIAPRTALWLGARLGWFMPFGSAWARGSRDSVGNLNLTGVPWRDYVSAGPMFELDAGLRLSRIYALFALWEHAELGDGRGDSAALSGAPTGGDTDFLGFGVRATSDPDRVGFVTELAVGYRLARATFQGGEVQFTDAPFEARLGIGADVRLNPIVTLSPMLSLGVGSFGKIDRVSGGTIVRHTGPDDEAAGHAWATLSVGGHFDLLGSRK